MAIPLCVGGLVGSGLLMICPGTAVGIGDGTGVGLVPGVGAGVWPGCRGGAMVEPNGFGAKVT